MTLPHLVYIPMMIIIGLLVGWQLGTRSVRKDWDRSEKRRRDRDGA